MIANIRHQNDLVSCESNPLKGNSQPYRACAYLTARRRLFAAYSLMSSTNLSKILSLPYSGVLV